MASKLKEEKHQKILKELRALPANKRCFDCDATFPQYIVMDFGIWVCPNCSGLHREFSHKVKSPSMGTFKDEEINELRAGGNDIAQAKWRARWSSDKFPIPQANDASKAREFIRLTFVERKWADDASAGSVPVPASRTLGSSPSSAALGQRSASASSLTPPKPPKEDLLISWDEEPVMPQAQPMNVQTITNGMQGFDPFGLNGGGAYPPNNTGFASSPPPSSVNPFAAPAPSQTTVIDDDLDFFKPINITPTRPPVPSSQSVASLAPPPAAVAAPAKPSADQAPSCPVCGRNFPKGASNVEINRHLDECLNAPALNTPQSPSPKPSFRNELRGSGIFTPSSAIPANNRVGGGAAPTSPVDDSEPWTHWFDLTKMEWYYGAIDRKEAERILFTCTDDSFLVRKSSIKDSFALSLFNFKKQTVIHTLIEPRGGGYAFADGTKIYPTILDLVTKSPECRMLKPPPKITTLLERH